jgi:hypothetical protein
MMICLPDRRDMSNGELSLFIVFQKLASFHDKLIKVNSLEENRKLVASKQLFTFHTLQAF